MKDLTYDHIHWKLCQQCPDRSEFTSTVQSTLIFEVGYCSLNARRWRRINKDKLKRVT